MSSTGEWVKAIGCLILSFAYLVGLLVFAVWFIWNIW